MDTTQANITPELNEQKETAQKTSSTASVSSAVLSKEDLARQKIQEIAKQGLAVVAGGLGDMEWCDCIVEWPIITPPEGGVMTKFFGISYYFKGYPEKHIVEGLGMGKAMISSVPRRIIGKSIILQVALITLYFFSRKRFYGYLSAYFDTIHLNLTAKSNLKPHQYNVFAREVKRAGEAAIYRILVEHGEEPDLAITRSKHYKIWELAYNIVLFVCLFLEYDNAYRLRIQDTLPMLNKENVKKSARKEVKRLLGILTSREHPQYGISKKWRDIAKPALLLLRLSKPLRKFTEYFLLELELERVKLDEHDRYFCLKRRTYNFWGAELEERLKEKERIDKEKEHIILEFRMVNGKDASGNPTQGIHIEKLTAYQNG